LGLVTLGESLIASPSSLAFFPSAFFAAFSYRFASSCLSFYSCNVFPVLVVVLVAASCTEMEIGGAYVNRLKSRQGTQRGSVAHRHFWGKIWQYHPRKSKTCTSQLSWFSVMCNKARFYLA